MNPKDTSSALSALRDPESYAYTLSLALDRLTGGAHVAWELETTLLYLSGMQALPDEDSREKILAVIALRRNPAYLWDAGVFKEAALVLNDLEADPDYLTPCTPAQAAWAVVELARLHDRYSTSSFPGYGDEPCTYIAGVCANAGLVALPEQLEFVRDHLQQFPAPGAGPSFYDKVKRRVALGDKSPVVNDEDPVEVHAHRLFEIDAYVWHRSEQLAQQLVKLGATDR